MRRPIPSIPNSGDYRKFATDVIAYLTELENARSQRPAAIALASWTPDASASLDGVLMFHRALGLPVISVDGEWRQLMLGGAV